MKHLKYFESDAIEFKYSKGDYILLKDDDIDNKWNVENTCIIIKQFDSIDSTLQKQYYIMTYDKNNKPSKFWIREYEIERKLTTSEIEEYKIKKNSETYNL